MSPAVATPSTTAAGVHPDPRCDGTVLRLFGEFGEVFRIRGGFAADDDHHLDRCASNSASD